jgi:enoyl-[acyl-carrier protein] reductase I
MSFLQGRKILVTGLLSNRSIAYGIAKACKREGASSPSRTSARA